MKFIAKEITVPINSCVIFPLMITPYSTNERHELISRVIDGGGKYPSPHARSIEDKFEILSNWDVIQELKARGIETVKVLYSNYDRNESIRLAVVEQSKEIGLNWTSMSIAIKNIKQHFGLSDSKFESILGMERSNIAKLRNIAEKLSPRLFMLAEQKKISQSACLKFMTLPASKQDDVYKSLIENYHSEKKVLRTYFKGNEKPRDLDSNSKDNANSKSMDIKRAETTISEKVGFPCDISPNSDGQTGQISYLFFDFDQMLHAIRNARKGFRDGCVPKGKIVFSYSNLEELDNLTGKFFDEEF